MPKRTRFTSTFRIVPPVDSWEVAPQHGPRGDSLRRCITIGNAVNPTGVDSGDRQEVCVFAVSETNIQFWLCPWSRSGKPAAIEHGKHAWQEFDPKAFYPKPNEMTIPAVVLAEPWRRFMQALDGPTLMEKFGEVLRWRYFGCSRPKPPKGRLLTGNREEKALGQLWASHAELPVVLQSGNIL